MIPTAPKAVFFDLGHTVLNNDRYEEVAGHERLLEIAHNPRGVTLDDVLQMQSDSELAFPESDFVVQPPGVIRSLLIYHRLGMSFDLPPEQIDIEFCRAAHTFSHKPGIENTLQTIHRAGLPMAIISNSPFGYRALNWHLEQNKLAPYFAFIVSSTDYGIQKPHPLLMRIPADRLGIDPTDCWFAGDVPPVDVAGAQAVGMASFLYNSRGFEEKAPIADVEFDDWDEFTEIFSKTTGA